MSIDHVYDIYNRHTLMIYLWYKGKLHKSRGFFLSKRLHFCWKPLTWAIGKWAKGEYEIWIIGQLSLCSESKYAERKEKDIYS